MNHIKDLKPLEKNPRKHTARNIGVIAEGLQEVGAARSIVIDEENTILAGNGTVEAAAQAGITKLKIVETDGETIIAVRRKGLTDEQKKRLALIDNRSSDLGTYDAAVLAEYQEENIRLSDLFTAAELQCQFDQDTSFLDAHINSGQSSEDGSEGGNGSGGSGSGGRGGASTSSGDGANASGECVTLMFVVTPAQRSEIMQVLNRVAHEGNLATSGEALYQFVVQKKDEV